LLAVVWYWLEVEIQIKANTHVLSALRLCHKSEMALVEEDSRMLLNTTRGDFEVYRQKRCTVENLHNLN